MIFLLFSSEISASPSQNDLINTSTFNNAAIDSNSFFSLNNNLHSFEFFSIPNFDTELQGHEKESSFRRAEIIFFLSFPFVLAAHGIISGAIYYAATKDATFNIPKSVISFSLVSSVMISTAIAYYDYKTIEKKQPIRLSFIRQF